MRRVIFYVWVVAALGCSGVSGRPDAPVNDGVVAPGAQTWSSDAMRLPAGSPAVVALRPDRLEVALSDFLVWATDKDMYADKQAPGLGALMFMTSLGMDTASSQWVRNGGDFARTAYVGLRPIDASGNAFVEAVEETLAAKLRVAPEQLMAATGPGPAPVGLHAEILAQVSHLRPVWNARAILPANDAQKLTAWIDRVAVGLGWKRAAPELAAPLGLGPFGRAYVRDDHDWPAVAVRLVDDVVVVDAAWVGLTLTPMGDEDHPTAQLAWLKGAVSETGGRPKAPRPTQDVELLAGFDTGSMAQLVKLRGYQRAVAVAARADATTRDDLVLLELRDTLMTARAWSMRSQELPGVAYSLALGDEGSANVFELEMALTTAEFVPPLATAAAPVGIDVGERGLAGSFSLVPFQDKAWKQAFTLSNPAEALDLMDAGEADPFLFGLAAPRMATLVVGSLIGAGPNALNPISELAHVQKHLARVEFAWMGGPENMAAKMVLLGVMHDHVDAGAKMVTATQLTAFGARIAGWHRPPMAVEFGSTPTALGDDARMGYGVWGGAQPEHVVVGLGLEHDAFEAQRVELAGQPSTSDAIWFRAEPTTYLPLVGSYGWTGMYLFDTAVLAQRLGAVELRMAPDKDAGTQWLRWRIEWKRPPRL